MALLDKRIEQTRDKRRNRNRALKEIKEGEIVRCRECKSILDEAYCIPKSERPPCPKCGSTARLYNAHINVGVVFHSKLGMKARHGTSGRPFWEGISGSELFEKASQWVKKDRVIDRERDYYFERIIDPETGQVIHCCEELLSLHQGHGAAKLKNKKVD